ncbi:hypothetical protein GQ55_3G255000 [Panicum hallii var. hallii]|uniref:Uncharacterized protein n=1 Tax=Panicum hallii var. hallii TaxID=1504633 RepID=A0A2T7EDA6_9POAL|nr:hypothetical protein GQ55_3G255000 [Panicum hallii var. hallii]
MKMESSRDLSRKPGSLHCKKLHLICGENDVKGPHAEGLKFGKLQEASGSNRGMNWAVPTPRLTYQFIHHPPPRRREARGTPSRTGGSC